MAYGEAEDAGGLAPAKDNNETVRHFLRRTLTIFECVDYRTSPAGPAAPSISPAFAGKPAPPAPLPLNITAGTSKDRRVSIELTLPQINQMALHNPCADLPEMRIYTFDLSKTMPTIYRYETEDMAFNFREFFRT